MSDAHQRLEPAGIGFALRIARESQRGELHGRLACQCAAEFAGGRSPQSRASRFLDHGLQAVPLLHVLHLMREHAGQFLRPPGRLDQSGVHDDDATRQGEGIDGRIVGDVEFVLET